MEPPPDGGAADVGDDAGRQDLPPQLRAAEARQRKPQRGGQFKGQGLHFGDDPIWAFSASWLNQDGHFPR